MSLTPLGFGIESARTARRFLNLLERAACDQPSSVHRRRPARRPIRLGQGHNANID